MDTVNWVCVCAEDYYQTSTGDSTLVCAACPTGSNTNGVINSTCSKCCKIVIHILRY